MCRKSDPILLLPFRQHDKECQLSAADGKMNKTSQQRKIVASDSHFEELQPSGVSAVTACLGYLNLQRY